MRRNIFRQFQLIIFLEVREIPGKISARRSKYCIEISIIQETAKNFSITVPFSKPIL